MTATKFTQVAKHEGEVVQQTPDKRSGEKLGSELTNCIARQIEFFKGCVKSSDGFPWGTIPGAGGSNASDSLGFC